MDEAEESFGLVIGRHVSTVVAVVVVATSHVAAR